MACLHIQTTDGTIRKVFTELGEPVSMFAGEMVKGVTLNCEGEGSINLPQPTNQSNLFHELDQEIGGGAGDWIKALASPLARLVGKQKCSVCEAKRIATNAYGKLKTKYGQLEALRIIRELWKASGIEGGDTALVKLQEYLND